MLSDLNSKTRFGILSSFRDFPAPICNDLHILIFQLPTAFHFKNDFWAMSNRRFSAKRVIPCYSARKDGWESPRKPRRNAEIGKTKHPIIHSHFPTPAASPQCGRVTWFLVVGGERVPVHLVEGGADGGLGDLQELLGGLARQFADAAVQRRPVPLEAGHPAGPRLLVRHRLLPPAGRQMEIHSPLSAARDRLLSPLSMGRGQGGDDGLAFPGKRGKRLYLVSVAGRWLIVR